MVTIREQVVKFMQERLAHGGHWKAFMEDSGLPQNQQAINEVQDVLEELHRVTLSAIEHHEKARTGDYGPDEV